jgi:hypothetical protein
MDFQLRWISFPKYAELTVTGSNFSIESGPLNEQEQIELAKELREIADQLYVEEE